MNCVQCGKPVDPTKGGIAYPLTTDPQDIRNYCSWKCLLDKLDETLRDSRKLIEELKKTHSK